MSRATRSRHHRPTPSAGPVYEAVDLRTIVKAQLSFPMEGHAQSVLLYRKDQTIMEELDAETLPGLFEPGEMKIFLNVLWRGASDGMLVIESRAEPQDW